MKLSIVGILSSNYQLLGLPAEAFCYNQNTINTCLLLKLTYTMLIPLILATIAAIFSASTNHIDKYLISKVIKNADYRALTLSSTIIAGGVMALIYLPICNFNLSFDLPSILLLLFNSALYATATIVYFLALNRDDTTIIAILFQLIPVFMLFISPLVLGNQHISPLQLIGSAIITFAAITVTYEPSKKKFSKEKLVTFAMMAFSSSAYAIWFIIERYTNQSHDYNQTILWTNLTLLIVGIVIFVLSKKYRESFIEMLKSNGRKVIGLNIINELFNSFSGVFSTLGGTMTSIALVSFVAQGVQPFAVMLLGILITKLFPKIEKEKITKIDLTKRTITIVFCIIGLALIQFG